jgi:hypothetical protein
MVAHRPAVRQLESRRLMQVAADRGWVGRRLAAGRGEMGGLIELKRSYEQISRRFLSMMAVGGVWQGRVVVGEAVGFLRATRRLGLCVGRALAG